MLSVIKLADAEYTIGQVALGVEEYYLGAGEAPGVWAGRWAPALGLEGVVEAEQLRALVNGIDPTDGTWWLEGRPTRKVNAFDATFSAPKSVSLLWAFASPEVASVVARAHVQAVSEALVLLEGRAAVSRQQTDGVRTRVGTDGWAVATFVHRTSRAGDPQLHTHCVIPNVVRRVDGSHATLDGAVLYRWAKPAGSVYQEQLRRILTVQLGVEWGPDRNGTREMVGFTPAQLRRFSKRTSQIEAYLERSGGVYQTAVERMRADHLASLATRPDKDRSLTPERLRDRWTEEATAVGLGATAAVEDAVLGRVTGRRPLTFDEVANALVHPETGLCANDSRFGEAQVLERVAAAGAGRLTIADIETITADFLGSEHVARLSVEPADAVRTPPQFTTAAHLALEHRVLDRIGQLIGRAVPGLDADVIERAVAADRLGGDQADAVRVLCGAGPAIRSLIAPAGFGKTTAAHAAAAAAVAGERPVLGVATTNRAVAELGDVGIPSVTIARLAIDLADRPLAPGTVIILDELSQTATADADVVLAAVAEADGAQLWCLGDVRQAQAVRAGGLAADVAALGADRRIPAAVLVENRRQTNPAERAALAAWRDGDLPASQTIRTDAGLEHEAATPLATRDGMADAVAADILAHGTSRVVGLAVSHADCEDVADRIRGRLIEHAKISGAALEGPAWGGADARCYQAGDRVLLHANLKVGGTRLANGTALTVTTVTPEGLAVTDDRDRDHLLPAAFVAGVAGGGRPNISHAWCRTVDGAQGGTWDRVHLLGSGALDNFTAYVGQSRARVETHTWNVRRLPVGDWGGRVADDRTGAEQVLDAAGRAPLKTFAVHDDPFVLDAQLTAEIAVHTAVLAAAPPDVSARLTRSREQLQGAQRAMADAQVRVDHANAQAAAVSPVAALRRSGRDQRARWHQAAERARRDLATAGATTADLGAQTGRLAAADADHRCWVQREGWRGSRVADARIELDRHWAQTVATAVAQGDPLAYGTARLRTARVTFSAELRRLDASLPADRSAQLDYAEQALHNAQAILRHATQLRANANRKLQDAEARRFGRRNKTTLATEGVTAADYAVDRATGNATRAQDNVNVERAAVAARAHAETAIADPRRDLRHNLRAVTQALDSTRPERVLDPAAGHPDGAMLRDLLGDPPAHVLGRNAWQALAQHVDTTIDHPPPPNAEWYLERLVRSAIDRHPQAVHDLKVLVERAVRSAGSPQAAVPDRELAVRLGAGRFANLDPPGPPQPDRGIDLGL